MEVFTDPPVVGATVTLNHFSGITDSEGKIIFRNVLGGTYTLFIIHGDYEPWSKIVSVPEDFPITVTLTKKLPPPELPPPEELFTVTVRTMTPEGYPIAGAEIFWDGISRGVTVVGGYTYIYAVRRNIHTLKAVRSGFKEKTLTIRVPEQLDVSVALEPVVPELYSVRVVLPYPIPIEVYLDDRFVGKTNVYGFIDIPNVERGIHTARAGAFSKTFSVPEETTVYLA